MSAFRNLKVSKFRHAYGQTAKRENCYEGLRITTSGQDSQFCAVNTTFIAVVLEISGGGAFQVVPLNKTGKIDHNFGKVKGHTGPINDLKWNPFDDNSIATCSDDCTVKIWNIPDEGVKTLLTEWLCDLIGHERRVGHVEWHPTACNLLIFFWNVSSAECLIVLDCHQDVIYSLSFNWNGSLLATTCKDKMLRIINPRTTEVLQLNCCHESSKTSKVVFLGNLGKLLTTGFNRTSHRQYAVWDQNNLSQPLIRSELDSSAGPLFPFYDPDLNIAYLAGKGDGSIKFFEILNSLPYVQYLNEFQSRFPQRCFTFMPKRGLTVANCEIFRFYKVHTTQTVVEPVSIIVPRKTDNLKQELYPPTASNIPSLSVDEWLCGIDKDPILMSLISEDSINNDNKRKQTNFNICVNGKFSSETPLSPLSPLSPTFDAKFQFLSRITVPDYRSCTVSPINVISESSRPAHTFYEKRLLKKEKETPDKDGENFSTNKALKSEESRGLVEENGNREILAESKRKFQENRLPPLSSRWCTKGISSPKSNDNDVAVADNRGDAEVGQILGTVPTKIRRIYQSPARNEQQTSSGLATNLSNQRISSPSVELSTSPNSDGCFTNLLRTRSASPSTAMSPVGIRNNLDDGEMQKLAKPTALHFNGNYIVKPPQTKPGFIGNGPIVKRNEGPFKAKPCRISHSQPPTPRPDDNHNHIVDTTDNNGVIDKIFTQQSKNLREILEENYIKDRQIERLESEVAKLTLNIQRMENDLKQKQDDIDSFRYEIAWKDRRVVQLEQQLYKFISNN